jgi:hypothetical protein
MKSYELTILTLSSRLTFLESFCSCNLFSSHSFACIDLLREITISPSIKERMFYVKYPNLSSFLWRSTLFSSASSRYDFAMTFRDLFFSSLPSKRRLFIFCSSSCLRFFSSSISLSFSLSYSSGSFCLLLDPLRSTCFSSRLLKGF